MEPRPVRRVLLALICAYSLASLTHFFHNAEFCGDYPNLPAWITRSTVYLSWVGIAAIGVAGLWLSRGRRPLLGLGLLAVYALLGFAGLGHYARAPIARHTAVMNFTIWFEVITGAWLFALVMKEFVAECRHPAHRNDRSLMP